MTEICKVKIYDMRLSSHFYYERCCNVEKLPPKRHTIVNKLSR